MKVKSMQPIIDVIANERAFHFLYIVRMTTVHTEKIVTLVPLIRSVMKIITLFVESDQRPLIKSKIL